MAKKHVLPRLRPTQALIHDAVDATTYLVDAGHESTARSVVGALKIAGLGTPAKAIDGVRRFMTRGILGSVRLVNRGVEGASNLALESVEVPEAPTVPQRSDALVSPVGAVDQLVGVLNGAVGDHLASSDNGLDLGLRLRHGDQWIYGDPVPGERAVVLVHGLCTTELSWSLEAESTLGAADRHYGALLEENHGYTPIYARYNTGRPIADNGFLLADALDRLVEGNPQLTELVLIGHSMGGLVSRAATQQGAFVERLRAVICLGSPHAGAPLARFGHAAAEVLETIDLPATQVIGKIVASRSAGIHDLRHRDLEATGPLLDGVRYLFVAGSVAGGPEDPGVSWFGDGLVPVTSASGPEGADVTVRHLSGLAHHQLQAHSQVWELLDAFFTR